MFPPMFRIAPLLALGLAASLGACAGDRAPAPEPIQSQTMPARATDAGGYHVVVTPTPYPPPLNRVFELEVRVFEDAAFSVPAAGADVSVIADADMPAHGHGMNLVPRTRRVGDGIFRVTGMLFYMPGYWEIYIDVVRRGTRERATFEVQI
jgi:hypothetical protein